MKAVSRALLLLCLLQAFTFEWYIMLPSVLWRCWLGGRKGKWWSVKNEWLGAGVVVCLEQGAHLHMAQLMPLLLTVSCLSKIQIGFTFLVPAHPGSPGKRAVKRLCVCACVCVRACVRACVHACDILFNFGYVVQLPGLSTATCSLFELRTRVTLCWAGYLSFWLLVACKERKCGGTSASRDENGQVDVWR